MCWRSSCRCWNFRSPCCETTTDWGGPSGGPSLRDGPSTSDEPTESPRTGAGAVPPATHAAPALHDDEDARDLAFACFVLHAVETGAPEAANFTPRIIDAARVYVTTFAEPAADDVTCPAITNTS